MTLPEIVAAIGFITLTGPDAQVIQLNPETIATIRSVRGTEHFAPGVKCLIFTTDGKNVGVTETCDTVWHMLEERK
jgi:hypothetical protein